ncbi:ribulose-phosphate 3-epimerase [Vagococcus sp. BWB3-3]|uniref:Ribulose-phosphate 3-epimerase n=1 Tax=Vagococcus allomyrinae TaxID=2794353 RepID=A0A940SVV7_9ENTE|nr:ribulose-phosphate 3-epimerase [Vagococcus allomyrinae]MBP1042299.1 ribulose-phosphate 3-epimerase [Vagococcus allomyrinae]
MKKVVASIMCANAMKMQTELNALAEAGIDWLHCDVMDAVFVDNLAMAPYNLQPIVADRRFTTDIHLAACHPETIAKLFFATPPDYLTFHIEACRDPAQLIEAIHSQGIKAGIAISPATDLDQLLPFVAKVDLVLVMTVPPGFSGQAFRNRVLPKLRALQDYLKTLEVPPLVQVDGNINLQTIKQINAYGSANLFVVGTSGLFNGEQWSYREKVEALKKVIGVSG